MYVDHIAMMHPYRKRCKGYGYMVRNGKIQKGGAAYLERKLKALFDFQKYEQNADLQKIIDQVHARYNSRAQLLEDDDVEFVNAAGVQDTGMKEKSLLNKKDDIS